MSVIKEILIRRDGMLPEEAEALIQDAREELQRFLVINDIIAAEICSDWFGLEPDYLDELLF